MTQSIKVGVQMKVVEVVEVCACVAKPAQPRKHGPEIATIWQFNPWATRCIDGDCMRVQGLESRKRVTNDGQCCPLHDPQQNGQIRHVCPTQSSVALFGSWPQLAAAGSSCQPICLYQYKRYMGTYIRQSPTNMHVPFAFDWLYLSFTTHTPCCCMLVSRLPSNRPVRCRLCRGHQAPSAAGSA